jgi:hypothetical protein
MYVTLPTVSRQLTLGQIGMAQLLGPNKWKEPNILRHQEISCSDENT